MPECGNVNEDKASLLSSLTTLFCASWITQWYLSEAWIPSTLNWRCSVKPIVKFELSTVTCEETFWVVNRTLSVKTYTNKELFICGYWAQRYPKTTNKSNSHLPTDLHGFIRKLLEHFSGVVEIVSYTTESVIFFSNFEVGTSGSRILFGFGFVVAKVEYRG